MSVNNLRNYNWEQGTQASPVLLTGAEFNKLTALIEESNRVGSNINVDIRGWVQVGQNITSYQKYLAELAKDGQGNPLLHIVNTQIDPVSYTITPQSNSIKEGDSTKLNINGISLSALKFRITNHTVQSLDYRERTTIDTQLGYVRVAPAQENATWTDVVTIQTCPVWEEWSDPNASIVEFDITVNAISVSSVTITAPQYVKPTETFYPIVNFFPVNHTKPIVNTLEDAGAKRGICFVPTSDDFAVGKTTDPTKMSAIAPSTETPVGDTWSLGCGVYAFTSEQTMATPSANVTVKYSYIQFTVTTDGTFSDISSANPRITLQKVDSQDTPIGEPIVLTGTVSDNSLVYTYGEGNVAGDGSEYFKATLDNIRGYRTPEINTIHPTNVITTRSVSYTARETSLKVLYSDGTVEDGQLTIDRYAPISGKTAVAIKLETPYTEVIFGIDNYIDTLGGQNYLKGNIAGWKNGAVPDYSETKKGQALIDKDDSYTLDIIQNQQISYLTNADNAANEHISEDIIYLYYNKTIEFNGITYHGIVPLRKHLQALYLNQLQIDTLLSIFGKSFQSYAAHVWAKTTTRALAVIKKFKSGNNTSDHVLGEREVYEDDDIILSSAGNTSDGLVTYYPPGAKIMVPIYNINID